MTLENQQCRVEIEEDTTYTVNSTDNRFYDVILNPDNYRRGNHYTVFSIFVDLFTSQFRIALIGPRCDAGVSGCAILEEKILTVSQADEITQINIADGSIIRHIKLDSYGCNFAIYKVKTGYVIYGELEIIMLDFDFNKKWSFSGKDIFASASGKNPFELREKSIHLWDFVDNEYEIDFEGKIVKYESIRTSIMQCLS